TDDDGDGVADEEDAFPLDASETVDTDGDEIGNNADADDDGDGVPDSEDDLPLNSSESIDTDSDGIGNNADNDDDGDGVLDAEDEFPLDPNETVDSDGDGIGDNSDTNSPPKLLNPPEQLEVEENSSRVYDFDAADPDGDPIEFSLSGSDSNMFTISENGVLSFRSAPDFETPLDQGKDNVYDVRVIVTDQFNQVSAKAGINSLTLTKNVGTNREKSIESGANVKVRISNFNEDIIDFSLTGADGTSTTAPSISIGMSVDSYTNPTSISVLLWRGEQQYWVPAQEVSESNFKIAYSYTFELPTQAPSGIWEVRIVSLDTPSGKITYSTEFLKERGFLTEVEIYNPNSDFNDPELLSLGEFVISGNDADLATDILASLTVQVRDLEGGLDKAFSYLGAPNTVHAALAGDYASIDEGTDPDTATFVWRLDPRAASGSYSISDIRLYDLAGNESFYRGNEEELGQIGNYKFELDNPIGDQNAPLLTEFLLSGSIDSDGRKSLTISTKLDYGEDQLTDIGRQYVRFIGPDSGAIDRDQFVFTDDNYYQLTISLPLEAPD
ncbi:MAG: cadherin repeat domain-containing protein, partial [Betaproteobacteria bacterium]